VPPEGVAVTVVDVPLQMVVLVASAVVVNAVGCVIVAVVVPVQLFPSFTVIV